MEDWKRVLDVNLTAVFELCQLAAKQFMAQESKGKIITVASMLSFFGGYTVPAYAASKGGIYSLTHALALSRHPKAVWLRLPKHFAMNGQKKELM